MQIPKHCILILYVLSVNPELLVFYENICLFTGVIMLSYS